MARDPNDIFNDPFDSWDENIDTPRKPGRPSVRRPSTKGANGRPRVRPLQDKYSRKRGRPALTPGSVGDRIEREALVSGGYVDKSVLVSVKGLESSIAAFTTKIINPLSKSVSAFSASVNKFNAYHQQYLKDQVAISREMHETFKLFRKIGLDPVIHGAARTRRGTKELHSLLKSVADSGYTKQEFQAFVNTIGRIDDYLEKGVRGAVTVTEASESILKEYYKTSKGTSKFLNSVAYATEDIAEDINSLKLNLAKYFKGKTNVSILQDQTEALRKIEKNTAAPTIGKRILSSITGSIIALGKTAFKYNRQGTTQFIKEVTGYQFPNMDEMRDDTVLGRLGKVIRDTYDIAIRRKVRDAQGNLRNTWETAYTGGYGEVPRMVAEGAEKVSRKARKVFKKVGEAWNESNTKQWAEYFWKVGEVHLRNMWNEYGAQGERSINATITNYGSKKGDPHPGKHTNDLLEDVLRIMRKAEGGEYKTVGNKPIHGDNIEDLLGYRNRRNKNIFGEDAYYGGSYANTVLIGEDPETISKGYTFPQGKPTSLFSEKREKEGKRWGKGSSKITFESKSESDINSADISGPKAALGSIAMILGRITGYLKKIWRNKGAAAETVKEKSSGIIGGIKDWLLGAGSVFAGTKLGKALSSLKHGWKGGALKEVAHLGGLGLRSAKLGATARTLWDTFGWGSLALKAGKDGSRRMAALATFKNSTRLGRSALGDFIRRANIAASGRGTDWGSRIFGGLVHANKWGGLRDPLGWGSGLWHGLGVKIAREEGKFLPRISLSGRTKMAKLAGDAAKGGSRVRGILNAEKAASFAAKHPGIAKLVGTGLIGHTVAGVSGFTGGLLGLAGNAVKGVGKGAVGLGKGVAKGAVGLGKGIAKIPSKDKILGAVLGGVSVKAITKMGGKGIAKALAKQIPFLGALVGIGFGIHRFTKGDVLGGILEIVSGLLTLIPSGVGNAAALGIDAYLFGRDIKKSKELKNVKKNKKEELEKKKVTEAFGLGPNPTPGQVIDAGKNAVKNVENKEDATNKRADVPANKATRSETSHISNAQKTIDETNPYANNPYLEAVPLPKEDNKPRGFIPKVVNKLKAAGNLIQASLEGAAKGEKVYQDNDTGAINWNGKRHDRLLPGFRKALYSAAEEMYKVTGHKVNINSAIRTDQEQARLYYRWKKGDRSIKTPALPVGDYPEYGIKGTHKYIRTGHLVGGAVDVSNWKEFKPYALKYGLTWGGAKDYVHFQSNERAQVIGTAQQTSKPSATPQTNSAKVGDGDSYTNAPTPTVSAGTAVATPPNSNVQTEVSPMIQDYGLAIINSLLFT